MLVRVWCSSRCLCLSCGPMLFRCVPSRFLSCLVSMRVDISLFSSGMLGCCGVFLLVQFLCLILLRMSCGRSLSVLRILPTGMCFFPALYSMLVNVLFASCMSVGGCSAAKASSVSCVNLSQSAFL